MAVIGAATRKNTARQSTSGRPQQVGDQRLPDVDGQGQALPAPPFAPHHQLAVAPVEVIE